GADHRWPVFRSVTRLYRRSYCPGSGPGRSDCGAARGRYADARCVQPAHRGRVDRPGTAGPLAAMAATDAALYAWRHGQICTPGVIRLGGRVYWLSLWCTLALWLGWLPGSALAQVTMEARLGLQGVLRLGKLNVVTVQVQNTGGAVLGT